MKGRLTDSVIDTLQNYFGIASRSGHKTVHDLRHGLVASFFHVVLSKGRNFHNAYCPKSSDSWCQYQRDVCNKTNLHKHGPGIDDDVIKEVKPFFQELTKEEEQAECLHGQTHDANESFNDMILERAYGQLLRTEYIEAKCLRYIFLVLQGRIYCSDQFGHIWL